jgi:small-conductance mechanosensitive channel
MAGLLLKGTVLLHQANRCRLRRLRVIPPGIVGIIASIWNTLGVNAAESSAETMEVSKAGASQLEQLTDAAAPILGNWIRHDLVPHLNWSQLILATAVLVLVLISERGLAWALRRLASKPADALSASQSSNRSAVIRSAVEAALPPLSLLVWVWGACAALWLLLIRYEAAGGAALVLTILYAARRLANILILFWFLYRLTRTAEVLLLAWAGATEKKWDDVLAAVIVRALRLVVPLLAVTLIVPTLEIPGSYHQFFKQGAALLLIAALGFILFQLVVTAEKSVLEQYRIDQADNLGMRKVQTQAQVLKRVMVSLIFIFTLASMLMVFDSVRHFGTSLLASAGVVGIVVGFAAQRSIASLFAGVQLAFTQPIRLDDQVVLENESGRIEEITLTYVVVRIWDSRRLVVPVSYFMEKPFINQTRTTADQLGAVMLQVDYATPIAPLRAEMDRILEQSPHWDRRVKGLQVTDAKDHYIELRILASAASGGESWELRCELREKMVDFLQKNYPECLPRYRLELRERAALAAPPRAPAAS